MIKAVNSTQIESIRSALMERRSSLIKTLRGDMDRMASSRLNDVGDSGDGAMEAEYQNISSRLSASESRELEKINHALDRIDDGTYGTCDECEQPIPAERLEALPFATLCVRCQQLDDTGRL